MTEMSELSALDKAVAEGQAARENGIDPRQNPYGVNTILGFCWEEGWFSVQATLGTNQNRLTTSDTRGGDQQRSRIDEIWHKLPIEGQKWLWRMRQRDLQIIDSVYLNNGSEENFLKHWRAHKADLNIWI
jgi:hypothetical protein